MVAEKYKYLSEIESEAIFILRETAAQFKNPCLLFSGGKDSICLLQLAILAFAPCPIPFPLVHIDTGHNFPEVLLFRDELIAKLGLKLHIRKVEDTINKLGIETPKDKFPSRNTLQTFTLLETIKELGFDACIGGARRDEEKARSKERIFSVRNVDGKWQPEKQRPEVWNIYNGEIKKGEHIRVFPISNWTEEDVWKYIAFKKIELPSIYFSHARKCVVTDNGQLMALSDFLNLDKQDIIVRKNVRYRTVGDMTCTAAIESDAKNVNSVINELKKSKVSERGQTRMDDKISETGMEDRKVGGYF